MEEIIIVGAGGFGRELLQWIRDINSAKQTWRIKGFIDDNAHALDGIRCDYQIIGSIKDWMPSKNEMFAMGIAEPHIKETVVRKLKERGAQFASVIHPTALIADTAEYGEGIVMYPFSSLSVNCRIGDFLTLLSSGIPHDAQIGDYVTISSNCGLTRGVRIGNRAFLADHACILPERMIGEDAYVGMGSVVIRNVKAGTKVFGNPAKKID